MTRIGFAYNQKPDDSTEFARQLNVSDASGGGRIDEEGGDHSGARVIAARELAVDITRAPSAPRADDAYADWDSPETIAAVERALSGVGDVVRLEATPDFPQRLREARPDIVFNMAEGLSGQNREAHVPAICEFYGVPYSGSDPLTLSLCLNKARAKEVLSYHGIPNAPFVVVRDAEELEALVGGKRGAGGRWRASRLALLGSRFPLFAKPLHEGSSKGITERNLCRTRDELRAQVEFLLDRYAQPV